MAYADSAIDYTWQVHSLDPNSGVTMYRFDPADSTDSSRGTVFQRVTLSTSQYDSAGITAVAEALSRSVVTRWDQGLERSDAVDSVSFNAEAFIGVENSGRYIPTVINDIPNKYVDYNPLTTQYTETTTSDSYSITTSYPLSALDSDQKVVARGDVSITSTLLFEIAKTTDAALDAIGFRNQSLGGVAAQASWDATSGASFNWDSHQISASGISNVTRQAEGKYRVFLKKPMSTTEYTVVTGVGNEDYSGAGASPRQVALLSDEQTDSYFTVICERTDDAVNEDNAYFSVVVVGPNTDSSGNVISNYGSFTEQNLNYLFRPTAGFNDSNSTAVKNALGYNDSDWAQYLLDNGGTYGGQGTGY